MNRNLLTHAKMRGKNTSTRQSIINLLAIVSLAATCAFAAESPEFDPNGAYVIRIERPFVKAAPDWLPLRVTVQFKDGKGGRGGAFSIQHNNCWHPVDASRLRMADGKIAGELEVAFRRDAGQRATASKTKQISPDDARRQTLRVDIPIGTGLSGAAPGTVAWDADATGGNTPLRNAPARAWAARALPDAKPVWFELLVDSWSADPRVGGYDTLVGNSVILLRGRIEKGGVTDLRALGTVDRYQMDFADRLWTVASSDMRSDGKTLSGSVVLAGVSDVVLRHRYVEPGCVHPQPKGPLTLTIRADVVGDSLFGNATCAYDGTEHESAIQGRWRCFPYTMHADRTPREVKPNLQSDPELAEAALRESMIPIRPGEPGKRDFWTEYARLGGCSQRGEKDGRRIVQYGNKLMTIEEFRKARGHDKEQPYRDFIPRDGHGYWLWGFIAPPSFNLPETPGADRYRVKCEWQAPPRPDPIVHVAPEPGYQPGKGVPVVNLEPGHFITNWLVGERIPARIEKFLADQDHGARLRPEIGGAITHEGKPYRFALLDASRLNSVGEMRLTEPLPMTQVYFTVLQNDRPRHVRLDQRLSARGGAGFYLAGRQVATGRILRLEKGTYPLVAILHLWGPWANTFGPMFQAVDDEQVAAIEDELARPVVEVKPIEFELKRPWEPFTSGWKSLAYGNWTATLTGIDAAGKDVGKQWKIELPKKRPFNGPYYTPARSLKQAAIMHARWMHDNPRSGSARGLNFEQVSGADGADGQLWYTTYSALFGPLVVHDLSQDAKERAVALETAVNVGDQWLTMFASSFLGDTYKGWIFDQWMYGCGWLELYRVTGDARYADAAKLLASRLAECQLPSGAWMETIPADGHRRFDPETGLYYTHPDWPQEYDPSSLLYFLGRVRKELKTDEFKSAEDKAWEFQVKNTLARFDWRKQGPGESRRLQHPWPTIADYALHCVEYLSLDLPGRPVDWDLVADIARWCEDRAVDWTRSGELGGLQKSARMPLNPAAADENEATIRLALAYARLAQHTGSRLHRAKAEALVSTALAAQNPVSGQIPPGLNPDPAVQGSGDGGNRGEYNLLALWRLAELWEGKK